MLIYFITCLILAILFGGAYYAYRIAFYSPSKGREKIPSTQGSQYDPYRQEMKRLFHQLQDRPCEFVTTQSHDGLTLSGRYYHVADGAPVDIGFHGYRSSPMTDFTGGSDLSIRLGHNVLLIDHRAHGKSQGRTITFGIKERRDLLQWVNYAIDRFGKDVKIVLYGISMGGATVLMASELELPENVKGIIADCPYSSPLDIILNVGKNMPIPNWLIKPFAKLGARIYGGFDLEEASAAQAVRKAKVPILIIHGESDHLVPCSMSDLVSENPDKITRFTFPNANHGLSYLEDTARYQKIVMEFLEKIL